MQYGVVSALGLNPALGLYPVVVEPAEPAEQAPVVTMLPDTATPENCGGLGGVAIVLAILLGGTIGVVFIAWLASKSIRW